MLSSSTVLPQTHRDFLGQTSSNRQMPADLSYEAIPYETDNYEPYSSYSLSSPSSAQSASSPRPYANTSNRSTYGLHGITAHANSWQSSNTDPRMTRPRSTYPHISTTPYSVPSQQRLQPVYMENSYSYSTRTTSSFSTSEMANFGRYATGQGYFPRVDQPHLTLPTNIIHSHDARCDWEHCGRTLEDSSPAGIARHLRQCHGVSVTDNRTRSMCLWGGRCSKDMFPSSFGKHIAECHLRNMTKQCPHCGADFARADTLSRHIKAFCPKTTGARDQSSA